jgi:hypothetical protein
VPRKPPPKGAAVYIHGSGRGNIRNINVAGDLGSYAGLLNIEAGDDSSVQGVNVRHTALDPEVRQYVTHLAMLATALANHQESPEQQEAYLRVLKAREAALNKDKGFTRHLVGLGNWVRDLATQVGASTIAEIIKKQAGL